MIGDSEEEENNNNNKKRKKSSTNKGLLITIDLFHANYEILLITYQEFTIRNAKNAQKKIKVECKFIGFKNNRLHYKCRECNKPYTKLQNEAIENFLTLYEFCNVDVEKTFLLLGKGNYPYEFMDSWEKLDETSIPPKEAF